jgi:very-short-patch-repair endonuclease
MYDSTLEKTFHLAWKKHSRLILTPQHRFHPRRRWRFDFAHKPTKVAIEIQGWGEGHNSYKGMHNDYMKHNEAIRHGWVILYFMSYDIKPKRLDRTVKYVASTIEHIKSGTQPKEELPDFSTAYQRAVDRLTKD